MEHKKAYHFAVGPLPYSIRQNSCVMPTLGILSSGEGVWSAGWHAGQVRVLFWQWSFSRCRRNLAAP